MDKPGRRESGYLWGTKTLPENRSRPKCGKLHSFINAKIIVTQLQNTTSFSDNWSHLKFGELHRFIFAKKSSTFPYNMPLRTKHIPLFMKINHILRLQCGKLYPFLNVKKYYYPYKTH